MLCHRSATRTWKGVGGFQGSFGDSERDHTEAGTTCDRSGKKKAGIKERDSWLSSLFHFCLIRCWTSPPAQERQPQRQSPKIETTQTALRVHHNPYNTMMATHVLISGPAMRAKPGPAPALVQLAVVTACKAPHRLCPRSLTYPATHGIYRTATHFDIAFCPGHFTR